MAKTQWGQRGQYEKHGQQGTRRQPVQQGKYGQSEPKAGKSIWMAMIQGLAIAVIITAVGFIVGAWLLDQNIISDGRNQYIGIVVAIGALALVVGGGYTASISREKPVYAAIGAGVLYILLRIALAFIVGDEWQPDLLWWGQSLLQLTASAVGGVIGRFRK